MDRRNFIKSIAGGVAAALGIALAPKKATKWIGIDPACGSDAGAVVICETYYDGGPYHILKMCSLIDAEMIKKCERLIASSARVTAEWDDLRSLHWNYDHGPKNNPPFLTGFTGAGDRPTRL